jgi:hypothetical protein
MDYRHMTAPCGLPCFECYLHLGQDNEDIRAMVAKELGIPPEKAGCKGCRDEGGKCAHLPMACRVYPCAEEKGVSWCSECADFPCDLFQPYADNAKLWHNTKVYNLCLIKKLGLEKWAEQKAGEVVRTYSFGTWTL